MKVGTTRCENVILLGLLVGCSVEIMKNVNNFIVRKQVFNFRKVIFNVMSPENLEMTQRLTHSVAVTVWCKDWTKKQIS